MDFIVHETLGVKNCGQDGRRTGVYPGKSLEETGEAHQQVINNCRMWEDQGEETPK